MLRLGLGCWLQERAQFKGMQLACATVFSRCGPYEKRSLLDVKIFRIRSAQADKLYWVEHFIGTAFRRASKTVV